VIGMKAEVNDRLRDDTIRGHGSGAVCSIAKGETFIDNGQGRTECQGQRAQRGIAAKGTGVPGIQGGMGEEAPAATRRA